MVFAESRKPIAQQHPSAPASTISSIASMAKPVTSGAALKDGELGRTAPVHQELRELKAMMVGVGRGAEPLD
jgi:hypothetical protein